jgi:hypothetical protein
VHLANPEAKILQQLIDQIRSPHVPALLLPLFKPDEFPERCAARLLATHTRGDVFLDLSIQVISQFFVQLVFDPTAQK